MKCGRTRTNCGPRICEANRVIVHKSHKDISSGTIFAHSVYYDHWINFSSASTTIIGVLQLNVHNDRRVASAQRPQRS
ncbi:hypothetical protein J6590_001697 [Homalodisca vitripennis]|nr:hypothetical protein J6590_001697 [Homalodisca vitripennis]